MPVYSVDDTLGGLRWEDECDDSGPTYEDMLDQWAEEEELRLWGPIDSPDVGYGERDQRKAAVWWNDPPNSTGNWLEYVEA